MKFEVVTSMNKSYYNTIGKTMLESFIDKWPSEISLRIYTEEDKDTFDLPAHKRYTIYRLYDTQPELQEFIERNKNRPDQQNPKETYRPLPFDTIKGALQEWLDPTDEEGEISSEPASGFDDEKTDSNYSLSTKKKETKGDKFDKVFDDSDLPF